MSDSGYATVSLDDAGWRSGGDGPDRASLTGPLGCTETAVDAYRFAPGDAVALSSAPEQLCIPVAASGPLLLGDGAELSARGVARVPAGAASRIRAPDAASLFVVAAPADPDTGPAPGSAPVTVALDACEFVPPETSDVDTARLTARLRCAGMKVNARRLDPGGSVPYHTEGDQEELFVPLAGSAAMRVADAARPTPPGTITRVAPPVPRSAVDRGDGSLWVMIGAPPTGGPAGWDPGAEILE
ncbi:MAG: hypothetical protein ABEI11_03145 [Haloarculaceae archaeon]